MDGTGKAKGQRCRMLVRGAMNSALLEFEDGYRMVSSRNALRRVTLDPNASGSFPRGEPHCGAAAS